MIDDKKLQLTGIDDTLADIDTEKKDAYEHAADLEELMSVREEENRKVEKKAEALAAAVQMAAQEPVSAPNQAEVPVSVPDMVDQHLDSMNEEVQQIAKDRSDNKPEWYGKKKKKIASDVIVLVAALAGIALVVALFLHYRGINLSYQAELGEGRPDASVFFTDGTEAEYKFGKDVSLTEEGTYLQVISSKRWLHLVMLKVKDTIAPTAEDACATITTQQTLEPDKAVKNVSDASEWVAEWVQAPTFGSSGVCHLTVRLTDAVGNVSEIPATITIFEPLSTLTWPMGDTRPTADDFMGVDGHQAAFVTDLDTITWDVMGEYEVKLSVDSYVYSALLILVDGDAPEFTTRNLVQTKDAIVIPEDFVVECTDASEVTYSFVTEPDTSVVGVINLGILATDAAGNEAEERAELTIVDYALVMEASSAPLTENGLLRQLGYTIAEEEEESEEEDSENAETEESTDTAETAEENETEEEEEETEEVVLPEGFLFVPNELGQRFVTVKDPSGKSIVVYLTIRDTVAPQATVIEAEGYVGYALDPNSFIDKIDDATEVSVVYIAEPDWTKEGTISGIIALEDAAGNRSSINISANLVPDKEAPVIYAATDRVCYVNEAVAYLKEVYAVDNADPDVEIEVDKSGVNPRQEGEYPVTYTATDAAGNTTSVTVTYTFIEQSVTDEMLDDMVADIFSEIFVEGMNVAQQARAIFDYVFDQIYYTGFADHEDWKGEAYRGYSEGVGDCFTYYSLTYVLLNHIDCEVLSVERIEGIPGHEEHYWCLVNLGTGWYHFDTINVGPDDAQCFMFTQAECDSHSDHFWRYDKTKYPELETKPFSMDDFK